MSEQKFISEVDLSGDGGVIKQLITEGTGPTPKTGSNVSVHYVGTLQADGSKFDSSRDRDDLFEFNLGRGNVIKAWDLGVATMKKGEKCVLICREDYAYGKSGSPPKIPGGATLLFEVELFDWEEPEPDTKEEKIVAGNIKKEEGNKLFVSGNYNDAAKAYSKALKYFDHLYGLEEDSKKAVDAVKLPCYLNLAAAQIKLQEYNDARLNCEKALDIEDNNVKALFRKG